MADPGRVCRPCDWWETIFARCALRIVKRRGEKSGSKKWDGEDTRFLGLAALSFGNDRDRKRRGDSFGVIYLDFIFIVPDHAKVTIYRFFLEAPSWFNSDITNVTCRVRSSFCVSQRDEKRLTTMHGRCIVVCYSEV